MNLYILNGPEIGRSIEVKEGDYFLGRSRLSKHTSKALVERLFELVKKALECGDDVLISGFGKFSVRKKAPRRGRNPATGEDLILDARSVASFRCSTILKQRINAPKQSSPHEL